MSDLIERGRRASGLYAGDNETIRDLCDEIERLQAKINGAINVGHNDDCLFCGFKDRALTSNVVLDQQKLKLAAQVLQQEQDDGI